MNDPVARAGGSDRAVTRVLTGVAAATPVRSVVTPARDTATADVAMLSGVAASLSAKPPMDAERIAQIKKAIANGTFPILPATIADRLLALRYDWMNDGQA